MYKSSAYNYSRRLTKEIRIGDLTMGGSAPIRLQSMANTNTNDIEGSSAQFIRIVEAGADLVRLTTQGQKEVDSLKIIRDKVHGEGFAVPFVADVHFNANVADYAAHFLEKVRINPGNYVSSIKTGKPNEYTEEEYHQEFLKIKSRFLEFLNVCKKHNTAIRIGVNHGSLSERMLLRWGNTPEGMVESCMEFLRICRDENFDNVVISMKASNTVMMIQSVRLLVEHMDREGLNFPLHLGVTEAGDGEDGRIKSAVGIGGLMAEGIGDTIRVSLSEAPEAEIPVAKLLRDYITARSENKKEFAPKSSKKLEIKPFTRRKTHQIKNIGGDSLPVVISKPCNHGTLKADYTLDGNYIVDAAGKKHLIFTLDEFSQNSTDVPTFLKVTYEELSESTLRIFKENKNLVLLLELGSENPVGECRAFVHTLIAEDVKTPVIVVGKYQENDLEALQIKAAADLGMVFVDGIADGILLDNKGAIPEKEILSISFGILQASRVRVSKTEFISCPGCGRTHFDLQTVIARVKEKTSHLTGLKIGIMGCIVNGPGEMADADYGYVGGGRGTIMLYKKQECIEKGVPEDEAVDRLIELIKRNGDWIEPQ